MTENMITVRSDAGNPQASLSAGLDGAIVLGAALNTEGRSEQRKPLWWDTEREAAWVPDNHVERRLPALTTCLSTDCSMREGSFYLIRATVSLITIYPGP